MASSFRTSFRRFRGRSHLAFMVYVNFNLIGVGTATPMMVDTAASPRSQMIAVSTGVVVTAVAFLSICGLIILSRKEVKGLADTKRFRQLARLMMITYTLLLAIALLSAVVFRSPFPILLSFFVLANLAVTLEVCNRPRVEEPSNARSLQE